MKKLIVLVMAIMLSISIDSSFSVFADENLQNPTHIRVVAVSTRLYNSPSLSDVMKVGEEEIRVVHGEVFEVLSSVVNDYSFYEIAYNEGSAYILKAYVIDNAINSNNVKLDTNATIIKDVNVYEKVGENYNELDIVISEGERIKLLDGYNTEDGYCRMSVEIENEILTYYVPQSAISADGMSANGIIAISLIITCTSIILILFGFKKKKSKTKKV